MGGRGHAHEGVHRAIESPGNEHRDFRGETSPRYRRQLADFAERAGNPPDGAGGCTWVTEGQQDFTSSQVFSRFLEAPTGDASNRAPALPSRWLSLNSKPAKPKQQ